MTLTGVPKESFTTGLHWSCGDLLSRAWHKSETGGPETIDSGIWVEAEEQPSCRCGVSLSVVAAPGVASTLGLSLFLLEPKLGPCSSRSESGFFSCSLDRDVEEVDRTSSDEEA